jgi:hypothetical protein
MKWWGVAFLILLALICIDVTAGKTTPMAVPSQDGLPPGRWELLGWPYANMRVAQAQERMLLRDDILVVCGFDYEHPCSPWLCWDRRMDADLNSLDRLFTNNGYWFYRTH